MHGTCSKVLNEEWMTKQLVIVVHTTGPPRHSSEARRDMWASTGPGASESRGPVPDSETLRFKSRLAIDRSICILT